MPKDVALPESPGQLLEQLFTMFPEYRSRYDGPIHDDAPSFHSVLIDFGTFFGSQIRSLSEKQLRSFARLVNAAVEAGGQLENAFGTCVLEHLHQTGAEKVIRPHLSKAARDRTKA